MSPSPGPEPTPSARRKAKGIPTADAETSAAAAPSAGERRAAGLGATVATRGGSATSRSTTGGPATSGARRGDLDPDELAALEEQRDFLLRSLADLDREHDAGDLEDDDYQTLKDDYTARAADVIRAIEARHAAFADARRPRNLARTLAVVAGVALFAVVSGAMVAKALGARKAGQSASGGITVAETSTQKANACIPKMRTDPQAASDCFEKILRDDPENVVALTWSAWQLSMSADNFPDGQKQTAQALAAIRLEEAVKANPSYSYARAFRAVVAYRNGRFADAKQYLDEFRANDPSADANGVIAQMDLDAKIAQGLAGTSSTTTAPG